MRAVPFDESWRSAWEALVESSVNGTFMHLRRFVDYHGPRFEDRSLLLLDGEALVGVLPAAVDPSNPRRVSSHPGLSYGGLVHAGGLRGEASIVALEAAMRHFAELGHEVLRYKAVPELYHRVPVADDRYALFRLGAERYRCDLAASVDLEGEGPLRRNRSRLLARARSEGLQVRTGQEHLSAVWSVLTANLAQRFGVAPAHTESEMDDLIRRFPDDITVHVVVGADEVLAGLVHFHTPRAVHCQYSAASPAGRRVGALDLGFHHGIELARSTGRRWFDFGVCNEQDGRVLNAGLYDFKISFGAGSTLQEHYELAL